MITKIACHGTTLNIMEWIFIVRGQGSLELALEEMRMTICMFYKEKHELSRVHTLRSVAVVASYN